MTNEYAESSGQFFNRIGRFEPIEAKDVMTLPELI